MIWYFVVVQMVWQDVVVQMVWQGSDIQCHPPSPLVVGLADDLVDDLVGDSQRNSLRVVGQSRNLFGNRHPPDAQSCQ